MAAGQGSAVPNGPRHDLRSVSLLSPNRGAPPPETHKGPRPRPQDLRHAIRRRRCLRVPQWPSEAPRWRRDSAAAALDGAAARASVDAAEWRMRFSVPRPRKPLPRAAPKTMFDRHRLQAACSQHQGTHTALRACARLPLCPAGPARPLGRFGRPRSRRTWPLRAASRRPARPGRAGRRPTAWPRQPRCTIWSISLSLLVRNSKQVLHPLRVTASKIARLAWPTEAWTRKSQLLQRIAPLW